MITKLGVDSLLLVYLLAMLGTFLGTGSGFIQAVNERLDVWSMEKLGRVLSPMAHSSVAIGGLLVSALLGADRNNHTDCQGLRYDGLGIPLRVRNTCIDCWHTKDIFKQDT